MRKPEPWVKIALSDYRKIAAASGVVHSGAHQRSMTQAAPLMFSNPVANWTVTPDDEDATGFLRVYGGYLVFNGMPIYLPQAPVPASPPKAPWYPDPYPNLGTPVSTTVGADFFRVAVPAHDTEAAAALEGQLGFVYWATELSDTDETAPFPGLFFLAEDAAAMKTAFATYRFIQIVAVLEWTIYDPCGYRLRQMVSAPLVIKPAQPWDMVIDYSSETPEAFFYDCVHEEGGTVVIIPEDDVSVAMPTTGTTVCLAAKINTDAGTAEVLTGADLTDVTDQVVVESSVYIKKPLYKCIKIGGVWTVVSDYRSILRGMVHS